jgi:pilus assembly protein CpaF
MAERASALDRLIALTRLQMQGPGIDPSDATAVARIAETVVADYPVLAASGQETALGDPRATVDRIVSSISGFGPFEPLVARNTGIEDIFIEGARVMYFQEGRLRVLREPVTEEACRRFIDQLLADTEATLDRTHPVVDGVQVLGGRARLAAAQDPVSPHLTASIRLYVSRSARIADLVKNETLTDPAAGLLILDMWAKGSILFGGETGSGKSTVLGAVLREARANHCVRLVEESQELQFEPAFGGRLQCVPGGRGTSGADSLADLVKLTLRMKPDVLAVGEVRGSEAWDLARASRVGAGFLATIHANSAEDSLEALVLTALSAGENIVERLIRLTFSRSIHFVVFCERDDPNLLADGEPYLHQVTEIRALVPSIGEAQFSSEPVFLRKGGLGAPLEFTGNMPPTELVTKLERLLPDGITLHDVLTGQAGWRR